MLVCGFDADSATFALVQCIPGRVPWNREKVSRFPWRKPIRIRPKFLSSFIRKKMKCCTCTGECDMFLRMCAWQTQYNAGKRGLDISFKRRVSHHYVSVVYIYALRVRFHGVQNEIRTASRPRAGTERPNEGINCCFLTIYHDWSLAAFIKAAGDGGGGKSWGKSSTDEG